MFFFYKKFSCKEFFRTLGVLKSKHRGGEWLSILLELLCGCLGDSLKTLVSKMVFESV